MVTIGLFLGKTLLKSKIIKLLKCLKSWFRLGIFTVEDLHAIITLQDDGAYGTLRRGSGPVGPVVRTSPEFGRTVDHLYSFNLDRFRPLDHWSGPSGALDNRVATTLCAVPLRKGNPSVAPAIPLPEDHVLAILATCEI